MSVAFALQCRGTDFTSNKDKRRDIRDIEDAYENQINYIIHVTKVHACSTETRQFFDHNSKIVYISVLFIVLLVLQDILQRQSRQIRFSLCMKI